MKNFVSVIPVLQSEFRSVMRGLVRKPGFAIAVIVILALGIGINVATLGLLYRYYVSPLPYKQGGQLISVYFTASSPIPQTISITSWEHLKKDAPALADSGLYRDVGYNIVRANRQSRFNGIEATASMFSTLGVQPLLGRTFGPDSNRPGAQPVVILSYELWQSLFDGMPSAIGQTLQLSGRLFTVIGVMPANFNFPNAQAALWTPVIITAGDQDPRWLTNWNYGMVGRLRPGASLAAFRAQADVVIKNEIANYPDPAAISLFQKYHLGIAAQEWRTSRLENLHQSLVLVLSATALLMLLVWFNLANLFLARSSARRSELALRRILGAHGWNLTFSLARENFMLSLIGAALGVALGRFLLGLFAHSSLAVAASSISAASWPVLIIIALVLAVISTVIFTLMSVGFLHGNNLSALLGDASVRVSPGHGAKHLRLSLIAGQIAFACAIGGTGLFLGRSLFNLNAVKLGFNPDHAVTFKLSFPEAQYSYPKMVEALDRLQNAVGHSPGIEAVGISSDLPFDGSFRSGTAVYPRPAKPSAHPLAVAISTDAGHFRSLGLPLLAGRNFTPADANSKAGVAIIDALAAQQLFGTEDALGREFSFGSDHATGLGVLFRVIGVVPTVRRSNLATTQTMGSVYMDLNQVTGNDSDWPWEIRTWYLVVRSPLSTRSVISEVGNAAHTMLPDVPFYDIQTMNQRVAGSLASNRLLTVLVLLFAIGAIVLAAIGLYAVQAYAVAQRLHEFAIRAALGANRNRLLALVLGETARLLVIGLVVGLAGLAAIGAAFASAFYGIGAVDPAGMVIVVIVLALAALAASWIPAWRASRVPPMQALRER